MIKYSYKFIEIPKPVSLERTGTIHEFKLLQAEMLL